MRRVWLTLIAALFIAGGVLAFSGELRTSNDPTAVLPSSAESTRVAQVLQQQRTNPALVVFSRTGPLSDDELKKIETFGTPVLSENRDAAIVSVPLPADATAQQTIDAVTKLRAQVRAGLEDGTTAQVTGGAGFTADLASSFSGANTKLLIVTVVVVALLLIVTYRSPVLWIVPLAVVGLADRVGSGLLAILSRHTGLTVDDSTAGIVTVLVFGAGTDYALLLISRYREELRLHDDRLTAMGRALRGAGPAIAASAGTVILSLLTLLLADLGSSTAIGVSGAVGIAVAALSGLIVLPAALVVCGRGLFWPFVPRAGGSKKQTGLWERVGHAVAKRPVAVTAASVIVLGLLSTGILGTRLGLSETEQFRVKAEAVSGLETVSRYFPAGVTDPAVVLTPPASAAATLATITGVPGVASAHIAGQIGTYTQIAVVLDDAPDTDGSYATITALRHSLGDGTLVGGGVATDLDRRTASRHDLRVLVPVILSVVLLVLILLLRALVAPLLLIVTVIASFAAALGAGSLIFGHALADQVPLLSFLFLVALGVDYNIFLVTRAKEETPAYGTRAAMIHALGATGAVITSAGILLAAVFAVLGVLPVITLTQIGVVVGLGVLLDTLLVRTVLVPALATLCGDRFWWPARRTF